MNAREKNLAKLFGAVFAVVIGWKVVYPSLISPVIQLRSDVDAAEAEKLDLDAELEELEDTLRNQYHNYVLRSTGTNPETISNVFFDSLDYLLRDAQFGQVDTASSRRGSGQTSALRPRAPSIDRKTGIASIHGSISATGTIAQCVDFIHGFYELPYVARINSIKLTPTPDNQRANHDEVKLNAEVEAMVLPYDDRFGSPDFTKPIPHVAWVNADVDALRTWRPFTKYREPEIIVKAPTPPTPAPPTPSPRPREPEVPVSPRATEIVLRACSGYGIDEVLLVNVVENSREYVAVGDRMDGGELVLVDAWGAVVHKSTDEKDFGYYVYPIGDFLAGAMKLEEAAKSPELQFRMRQYLALREYSEREKTQRELIERERWEWENPPSRPLADEYDVEGAGPVTDDPGWTGARDDAPPPPLLPSEGQESPSAKPGTRGAGDEQAPPVRSHQPRPFGPFESAGPSSAGVDATHPTKRARVQEEDQDPRAKDGPKNAKFKHATRRAVGKGEPKPSPTPVAENERKDDDDTD